MVLLYPVRKLMVKVRGIYPISTLYQNLLLHYGEYINTVLLLNERQMASKHTKDYASWN